MIEIEYPKKLHDILTKPKRIKILVGGRASAKSVTIGGLCAAEMAAGKLWCCARENLNSIDESVHRTICDEIDRYEIPG